ncbi:protein Spindly [Drosophila kikkawai]|uniref:Protein Spindly n=1 Tax=Drosophila kikkawai TaxID=30033 RepID=A0A6P4JV26_DROKI|nr:protein Spindly [Drosophila kikkawai]
MYNNLDLKALAVDDIVEEYKLLHQRHQHLKTQSDQDAQRIHELKRNLDTALAAEAYLTQELEQLSSQPQPNNTGGDSQELEDLRRKYRILQEEQESLQQDYDQKAEEGKTLKKLLEAKEKELLERASLSSRDLHEECAARVNALELENSEMMQKLADYEENSVKITLSVAEKDNTLECLADRVSCLEQNLNCKRDELEEKLQLLESCQEQLVDANAKIALLTSAPENNERKGNSLFAEVDDQRQAMKQLLAAQKKSYLEMKKTYADSQFEIRRLKRENVAMHSELQACSTIFCSADKTYRSKLNERIRYLMATNDSLEKQLKLSQERLRDLAKDKAVNWLDSMLDFCKRETHELKTQVHSLRIQKAGLEDQMRSVQQEMARWRFESLKSRCVLIDRENLLTEHKIGFKPMQAMEFNIQEEELKAALPRIATPLAVNAPPEIPKKEEIIILETPIEKDLTLSEEIPVEIKKEPGFKPLEKLEGVKTIMGFKIKREEVSLGEEKDQENVSKEALEIKEELKDFDPHKEAPLIKEEIPQETLEEIPQEPLEDMPKPQMKGTPVRGLLNPLKNKNQQDSPELQKDLNQNEVQEEIQLETLPKPLMKGTPVKHLLGSLKVKSNEELLYQKEEPAKPQRRGTPVKKLNFLNNKTESDDEEEKFTPSKSKTGAIEILDSPTPQKPQRKGTPVRLAVIKDENVRSILSKKRDIFAEDSHKVVKFSESDPTIHNLSPVELAAAKENEKPTETEDVKDIKPAIRRPIVRRIVVSSRKATMK